MSLTLAFFADYSEQIGTGHLIENFYLLKLALARGFRASMWIPDTVPTCILERFSYPYNFFHCINSQKEISQLQKSLIRGDYKGILFNFAKISNETLSRFKHKNLKRICIDELGNRQLDCDILINPSIVERYHRYPLNKNGVQLYAGPSYLSMSPGFLRARLKKKVFNKEIMAISVCMGGVDRTGTTLKLIDVLATWKHKIVKNIILGGGFRYLEDVHKIMKSLKDRNFRIYHNITNIESLFLESDIAFTAGGNTLYELACVGTPAIVLYEDKHEQENGKIFEKNGFGLCLGRGNKVARKDILSALKDFEDINLRLSHSLRGKQLVDGRGNHRILSIIERSEKDDRAVKAPS